MAQQQGGRATLNRWLADRHVCARNVGRRSRRDFRDGWRWRFDGQAVFRSTALVSALHPLQARDGLSAATGRQVAIEYISRGFPFAVDFPPDDDIFSGIVLRFA